MTPPFLQGAPFLAAAPLTMIDVAGAYQFSLGIRSDNVIRGWGENTSGQLGTGTPSFYEATAVSAVGISNVIAVAGGGSHTLALKSDGTVWAAGSNSSGQLGDGSFVDSATFVNVPGLSSIIAIACGNAHSVALKSDGTVYTWGNNGFGQLGNGTTGSNQSSPVTLALNAIAIAAGSMHSIAAISGGTCKAWGWNGFGQLGDGTNIDSNVPLAVSGVTTVTKVAGGFGSSYALKSGGGVSSWGANLHGQLGNGNNTDSNVPVTVSGISTAIDIATSSDNQQGMVLLNDNTISMWGNNTKGQLGNNSTTDRNVPGAVPGIANVTKIGNGRFHAFALIGGVVWAWGWNGNAQLGDGGFSDSLVPESIAAA